MTEISFRQEIPIKHGHQMMKSRFCVVLWNIAALGSNLIEHFFGNLRYLSHHDKSINGMINAMMNIMIQNKFATVNKLNLKINKRSATTEMKLPPASSFNEDLILSFGDAIHIINQFLNELGISTAFNFIEAIDNAPSEIVYNEEFQSMNSFINYIFEKTNHPEKKEFISSKDDNLIHRNGIQIQNLIQFQYISNFINS